MHFLQNYHFFSKARKFLSHHHC